MSTDWHTLAIDRGFENDEEMLRALYSSDFLSISALSEMLHLSKNTIRQRLQFHYIPIRARGGPNNAGKGKSRLDEVPNDWWLTLSNEQIALRLKMHPSTVNKYKRRKEGSSDEKIHKTTESSTSR